MDIVDGRRAYPLNPGRPYTGGAILYWMSREQRLGDNWGLLYGLERAREEGVPFGVVFTLPPAPPGMTRRHCDFLLRGLEELEEEACREGLPFQLYLTPDPAAQIASLVQVLSLGEVVCDFDPLRPALAEKAALLRTLSIPLTEVDGHNVFPCRVVSPKQEFSARTLRIKMERLLTEFLQDFPSWRESFRRLPGSSHIPPFRFPEEGACSAAEARARVVCDESVPPAEAFPPGSAAGTARMEAFVRRGLPRYDQMRNDPNEGAQSELSPYLHFGQISAQRVAWEAAKQTGRVPMKGSFFDEIIVRKELSDNFCLHCREYDVPAAFPRWAAETLALHREDPRDFLYNREEWEEGRTHDPLWNAAQKEMVLTGKMHGYMRMYWAKKILEWSPDPAEALETAIFLNDKYSLDGRDPNGYAGCAWSIGGLHDRAWARREVFGTVRYMNDKGCRRKFDTAAYIRRIAALENPG